jgi:hypothetical protein
MARHGLRREFSSLAWFVPVIGGTVASSFGSLTQGGELGVRHALALLAFFGGAAILLLTRFESTMTRWILVPVYLIYALIVMLTLELNINPLHLRMF